MLKIDTAAKFYDRETAENMVEILNDDADDLVYAIKETGNDRGLVNVVAHETESGEFVGYF